MRRGFRIASPELFSKLQSEARLSKLELKLVNNSAPRAKRIVKKIFSLQGPFINELPSEEERAGWLRIRFSDRERSLGQNFEPAGRALIRQDEYSG
jgi:hypothetical protein